MLLTLAGAVTLYLGERGILPYGIQISWVMVGIAILVYLVSPTKKNITTREPDGPVV